MFIIFVLFNIIGFIRRCLHLSDTSFSLSMVTYRDMILIVTCYPCIAQPYKHLVASPCYSHICLLGIFFEWIFIPIWPSQNYLNYSSLLLLELYLTMLLHHSSFMFNTLVVFEICSFIRRILISLYAYIYFTNIHICYLCRRFLIPLHESNYMIHLTPSWSYFSIPLLGLFADWNFIPI